MVARLVFVSSSSVVFSLLIFLSLLLPDNLIRGDETYNVDEDVTTCSTDADGPTPACTTMLANKALFSALRRLDEKHKYERRHRHQLHSSCGEDVLSFIQALSSQPPKLWALNMADSYGKPMSKITLGNWRWPGSYGQCLRVTQQGDVNATTGKPFKGRYCWASLALNPAVLPSDVPELNGITPVFQSGICVPDSCSSEMLLEIANLLLPEVLQSTGYNKYYNVSQVTCQPTELSVWDDPVDVIAALILIIFICLVVCGTIVDLCSAAAAPTNKKNETPAGYTDRVCEVLKAFSAYTNLISIFKNNESASSDQTTLHSINGLRVLSLMYVIHGHTWESSAYTVDNYKSFLDTTQEYGFLLWVGAPRAVDTFLVLSGCMVAYNFLRAHDHSRGRIPWMNFYLHRYVRLTAVYLATIFVINSTLLKYFVGCSGPFSWDVASREEGYCRRTWWWNILYIQNFAPMGVPFCMIHTWYLAIDFQLYVISPIFLFTFTKSVRNGLVLAVVALIGTCSLSAYLAALYNFPIRHDYLTMRPGVRSYDEVISIFYIKPYTRMSPYIVGLLCGWFLQRNKCKFDCKNKALLIVGWASVGIIFLTCHLMLLNTYTSLLQQSVYHGLNCLAWGLMIGWIIIACCTGHGGIVNSILSLPIWTPLSRLSYSSYIIHTWVIGVFNLGNQESVEYTKRYSLVYSVPYIVASFAASLPLSLMFEVPFAKLEQVLRRPNKTQPKIVTKRTTAALAQRDDDEPPTDSKKCDEEVESHGDVRRRRR